MRITALIVAAGSGSRLAAPVPKAFLDLGGRPLLAWSLAVFQAHPSIDRIVLLAPEARLEEARRIAAGFPKVAAVEPGGARRQDTVSAGLRSAGPGAKEDIVLVHDAARPFVTAPLIDRVVEAARRTGAAIPGVPPVDTVRSIASGRTIRLLDRNDLVLVQTPQGFRADLLARAYAGEAGDVTDDAALVERLGLPVEVVPGDPDNFKITGPADLERARSVAAKGGRP